MRRSAPPRFEGPPEGAIGAGERFEFTVEQRAELLGLLLEIARDDAAAASQALERVRAGIDRERFAIARRPTRPTPGEVRDALAALRDSAEDLLGRLIALDDDPTVRAYLVDGALERDDVSRVDGALAPRAPAGPWLHRAQRAVAEVHAAALEAHRRAGPPPRGRPDSMAVGLADAVAEALAPFGLAPSKGGPFRAVCAIAWRLAGASGSPDDAIAALLESRTALNRRRD